MKKQEFIGLDKDRIISTREDLDFLIDEAMDNGFFTKLVEDSHTTYVFNFLCNEEHSKSIHSLINAKPETVEPHSPTEEYKGLSKELKHTYSVQINVVTFKDPVL